MMLTGTDTVTRSIVESGCVTWEDLVRTVRSFQYGRNSNRFDFQLVWEERRGSCSSKHAFLKQMAERNAVPGIQLMLGIYRMNGVNTPAVGSVLNDHGLDFIPEAHCFLHTPEGYLDVTTLGSRYETFANDILLEQEIEPQFVIGEKEKFHREFLQKWIIDTKLSRPFDEVWDIREACIRALGNT